MLRNSEVCVCAVRNAANPLSMIIERPLLLSQQIGMFVLYVCTKNHIIGQWFFIRFKFSKNGQQYNKTKQLVIANWMAWSTGEDRGMMEYFIDIAHKRHY